MPPSFIQDLLQSTLQELFLDVSPLQVGYMECFASLGSTEIDEHVVVVIELCDSKFLVVLLKCQKLLGNTPNASS